MFYVISKYFETIYFENRPFEIFRFNVKVLYLQIKNDGKLFNQREEV